MTETVSVLVEDIQTDDVVIAANGERMRVTETRRYYNIHGTDELAIEFAHTGDLLWTHVGDTLEVEC